MRLIAIAAVPLLFLTSCSSKNEPSDSNFKHAIDQYLSKKGAVCIDLFKWPNEVSINLRSKIDNRPDGPAAQMRALESVGLVSSHELKREASYVRTEYNLTAAGKKALRKENSSFSGDLCYGSKSVETIVKWDIPASFRGMQVTTVTYTYNIIELAPWANDSRIQKAFPDVKRTLDGSGTEQSKHDVKLTNVGWEAVGLD